MSVYINQNIVDFLASSVAFVVALVMMLIAALIWEYLIDKILNRAGIACEFVILARKRMWDGEGWIVKLTGWRNRQ